MDAIKVGSIVFDDLLRFRDNLVDLFILIIGRPVENAITDIDRLAIKFGACALLVFRQGRHIDQRSCAYCCGEIPAPARIPEIRTPDVMRRPDIRRQIVRRSPVRRAPQRRTIIGRTPARRTRSQRRAIDWRSNRGPRNGRTCSWRPQTRWTGFRRAIGRWIGTRWPSLWRARDRLWWPFIVWSSNRPCRSARRCHGTRSIAWDTGLGP